MLRGAGLVAVALFGGLVALGGVALTGDLGGDTTTVVRTSPAPTGANQVAGGGNSLSVAEIYDRAAPGVVLITSTSDSADDSAPSVDPFGSPSEPLQALGSGFVIDKAGHIVTNYHVIEGAEQIEVSFSAQDTLPATLVGSDPSTDIAVLRVQASSRGLTPLPLGDSGAVRVGDPVVAIGNPFGLARTTTAGIVSAVQERTITAPNGYPIDHVIQTDAQINQGNSGGPLLNDRAQVIGVNSQIAPAAGSSGNVGIGFAVPANTVKEVVEQLVATGKVDRAFLGIGGQHGHGGARAQLPAAGGRGRPRRERGRGHRRRQGRPDGGHGVDSRRGRELHARRRRDRRSRRGAASRPSRSSATSSRTTSRATPWRSSSTGATRR